ncbi:hypothetical protein CDAR_315881 [Caerostris darwini]|uniref:Transmembrane protein n=1 Tax=Caerostris darwini TaxID=1538125 RepID=A0AAV4MC72_9ARAC|nr:hypothetical protein CDAR_315881 [Caerostris darwini]
MSAIHHWRVLAIVQRCQKAILALQKKKREKILIESNSSSSISTVNTYLPGAFLSLFFPFAGSFVITSSGLLFHRLRTEKNSVKGNKEEEKNWRWIAISPKEMPNKKINHRVRNIRNM